MNIHSVPDTRAYDKAGRKVRHCVSCQAEVSGNFCAMCGETTTLHRASAAEFLHEFIGHFVALEGKLLQTLRILMLRPGRLTVDFLQGRRVPFINPLRLYLTLSLVMFALIKLYGIELPHVSLDNDSLGATYSHSVPDADLPGKWKTATLVLDMREKVDQKDPARSSSGSMDMMFHGVIHAIDLLQKSNPRWAANFQQFLNEPTDERSAILNHGFLTNLPYMLIGALPIFALYLKVIYFGTGRYYGEHLVFALHTNAFAFLLASLMIVIPGNVGWLALCLHERIYPLISVWDWIQLIPFLWLVAYLPFAMHCAYGGTKSATFLRWLVLISSHLLVISTLTVFSELIGILGHG